MTNYELMELLKRITNYQWNSIRWFMTDREYRVIGLMCRRPKPTLARAARDLKVTPERIRQIYHRGIRHILWQIKKLKALGEYDFILNPKPILHIEDEPTPVKLDLPLEYLELSERVRNCFLYTGRKTIRDVVSLTENDLMAIKNFGSTSLMEVKQRLADLGLKLRK